jgi:hypothetical protein
MGAGQFLSVCGTIVSGIHPDMGEFFLLVEPSAAAMATRSPGRWRMS